MNMLEYSSKLMVFGSEINLKIIYYKIIYLFNLK